MAAMKQSFNYEKVFSQKSKKTCKNFKMIYNNTCD